MPFYLSSTPQRRQQRRQQRRPQGRLKLLTAALALLGLLHPAAAATWHWTGAANANWSDATNWLEGLPVNAADTELVLDAAARATSFNDIVGGLVLNRLIFGANAALPELSGQALHFQGANPLLRMLTTSGHATVRNAMQLASTLSIDGGGGFDTQLLIGGAISGNAGLTLASGTAVLSGNNSYTGATSVAGGAALGVARGGLAGSSGVNVAAGGELQIVQSSVVTTLNVPIQLSGVLSSSAQRVNTVLGFVGGAFVQGPVTLTGSARLNVLSGSGEDANVSELQVNSVSRNGHALTLGTAGQHNELRVRAINGDGDLLLRPAGGLISIGSVAGNGAVIASGAPGNITLGSVAGDGALRLAFDPGFGDFVTITGVLSGNRSIDVQSGRLTLRNAAHSFVGLIQVGALGEISAGRASQLGHAANALRFDGGGLLSLTDGGASGLGRAIATTGGVGTVAFVSSNASNTISSVISGDGGFGVSGGLITLNAANSFAGGLVVDGGTILRFLDDGNLGLAGGSVALSGTLALPDGYELARPLTLNSSAAAITGSGHHRLSSATSGSGRLNLGGPARYLLSGTASHSGGVALAGEALTAPAVLVLDSDARLGGATGVLNIGRASGLRVLAGTLEAAADLSIAATRSTTFRGMTVDTNGFNVTFNQPISGLGMSKAGLGTWRLNTANTDSSNTNEVRVGQGTLQLGVNEALGTRSRVQVDAGARLDLAGHQLTLETLNTDAGSTVALGSAGSARLDPVFGTINGEITGAGTFAVGRSGFAAGAVTLAAANSFGGSIQISHGSRLTLDDAGGLGAAGNTLRLDNGTLVAGGKLAAPLLVSASMALQIGVGGAGFSASGQSLIIEQALTGHAPLFIGGGSQPGDSGAKYDVRLANAGNSFARNLQLGDPLGFGSVALGITADGSLGAVGNRLTLGAAIFDGESTRVAQGGLRAWAPLTLAGGRDIQLEGVSGETAGWIDSNGFTVTLQGGIGELKNGLSLLKVGQGTLVMNGINSYTGTTQVTEGALGGHGELASVEIGAAVLAPGESAGLLTIRNNLSFSGGGQLWMELGGLERGVGYDALDVGGQVDLGSDTLLRLDLINGFGAAVQAGQRFQLLGADTDLFGSFANVADGERLLTADGMGSFVVHYGAGRGLSLSGFTAAVPEPSSYALMAMGLIAVAGLARRRKLG